VSEPEVFVLADRALCSVVCRIQPDQWGLQLPPTFQRRGTGDVPTLREIINYHAYDEAWVPSMLAGLTMREVGDDAFTGDLLADDPAASFTALVEAGCAAAEAISDLSTTVHCSFGDFTAQEYFWQITMFRGLRAYDIAQVIGCADPWTDELVAGLWDQIAPHAEEWRGIGLFPPAVPVPTSAPLRDRLLGCTGRPPRGT
jgi:hypothetical protein